MGQSFYNALIDILVMLYRRSNRIRCAPLAHSIWRGIASLVYLLVYRIARLVYVLLYRIDQCHSVTAILSTQMTTKRRFIEVSEEDIEENRTQKYAKNTLYSTNTAERLLKECFASIPPLRRHPMKHSAKWK